MPRAGERYRGLLTVCCFVDLSELPHVPETVSFRDRSRRWVTALVRSRTVQALLSGVCQRIGRVEEAGVKRNWRGVMPVQRLNA